MKSQFEAFARGATVRNLNIKLVSKVKVLLPPLAEQERIVTKLDVVFGEIDQAIAQTEKKEAEVEQLKAALLSISLAGDDWKTVKLGEVCEVVTKGTTPTSVGFKFQDIGINFIKVESISQSGTFITSKFAKISTECNEALKRSQLKQGDMLFSIAGALGRTAVVTNDILPANTNQAIAIVRLKENFDIDKRFLLHTLNSDSVKAQSDANKGGVAQQNLSLTQLKNYYISFPPLAEQKRIVAKLDAAFAEIETARNAITKAKENYQALKAAILTQELQPKEAA